MTRQSVSVEVEVPESDQVVLPPCVRVKGSITVECYAAQADRREVVLELADRIEAALDQQIQDVAQEAKEGQEAGE